MNKIKCLLLILTNFMVPDWLLEFFSVPLPTEYYQMQANSTRYSRMPPNNAENSVQQLKVFGLPIFIHYIFHRLILCIPNV